MEYDFAFANIRQILYTFHTTSSFWLQEEVQVLEVLYFSSRDPPMLVDILDTYLRSRDISPVTQCLN